MKAIQIETFGNPVEVRQNRRYPEVGAPAAGEVVIALEASPINQYDLLMIAGGYGYRPRLPAIMGTEGVGHVVAVGAGVKHLKEGIACPKAECWCPTAQRAASRCSCTRAASFSRSRRYAASGFFSGINQPSRMKSRRCSIIWRR